jgi:hypothetical protein
MQSFTSIARAGPVNLDFSQFCRVFIGNYRSSTVVERRKSARSRVLKSAKLVLGQSSIIDCVVRNVTNSGARIQIANTVDLPKDFEMTFDGGHSIRPCRLVWRTVTETGVEFV